VIEQDAAGTAIKDNFLFNGGGTGSWALLSGTLTATASTRSVSLRLIHHISAGTFTWDDVSFAPTNLAPNPSFELGGSTSLTGWPLLVSSGSGSATVSASARSGGRAAQVIVSVPGDVNLFTSPEGKAIAVTPSTAYTYSAYVLSSGGALAGLRLIEWNDAGQAIRDNFLANGGGTGSWQKLTGVLTTTNSTRFVSLRLVHHISAGTFKWDDIAFTKN
jgi:hypothetical protein